MCVASIQLFSSEKILTFGVDHLIYYLKNVNIHIICSKCCQIQNTALQTSPAMESYTCNLAFEPILTAARCFGAPAVDVNVTVNEPVSLA